ncbi:hypothetical protein C8F04DRAFT_1181033, partial [Mycena alexandri]
ASSPQSTSKAVTAGMPKPARRLCTAKSKASKTKTAKSTLHPKSAATAPPPPPPPPPSPPSPSPPPSFQPNYQAYENQLQMGHAIEDGGKWKIGHDDFNGHATTFEGFADTTPVGMKMHTVNGYVFPTGGKMGDGAGGSDMGDFLGASSYNELNDLGASMADDFGAGRRTIDVLGARSRPMANHPSKPKKAPSPASLGKKMEAVRGAKKSSAKRGAAKRGSRKQSGDAQVVADVQVVADAAAPVLIHSISGNGSLMHKELEAQKQAEKETDRQAAAERKANLEHFNPDGNHPLVMVPLPSGTEGRRSAGGTEGSGARMEANMRARGGKGKATAMELEMDLGKGKSRAVGSGEVGAKRKGADENREPQAGRKSPCSTVGSFIQMIWVRFPVRAFPGFHLRTGDGKPGFLFVELEG